MSPDLPYFVGQVKFTSRDGSQIIAFYLGQSDFSAVATEGLVHDEIIAVVDGLQSRGRYEYARGQLSISSDTYLVDNSFEASLHGVIQLRFAP